MSSIAIIVSGCDKNPLEGFFAEHGIEVLHIEPTDVAEFSIVISADELERAYDLFRLQAASGWEDPDSRAVLKFDHAFFPESVERAQPLRHLRGLVAARLRRVQEEMAPAGVSPSKLFGAVGRD